MIATKNTEEEKTMKYPCLKELGKPPCLKELSKPGLIVLFTSEKSGVVVVGNGIHPIGRYSKTWLESLFVKYTGTVTLKND